AADNAGPFGPLRPRPRERFGYHRAFRRWSRPGPARHGPPSRGALLGDPHGNGPLLPAPRSRSAAGRVARPGAGADAPRPRRGQPRVWRQGMISVVCPFYNEESIIESAVRRLLAALTTLPQPYELIVVNDGSTDRSLEIVEAFAEDHPELRIVSYPD